MSKWDGYYRHFQYHVNRNPNYTFTHFVYIHFLDGDHNQWLENRHRSVPFKSRSQVAENILFYESPDFFKIIPDENYPAPKFPYLNKVLLSGFLSGIIKPPCC